MVAVSVVTVRATPGAQVVVPGVPMVAQRRNLGLRQLVVDRQVVTVPTLPLVQRAPVVVALVAQDRTWRELTVRRAVTAELACLTISVALRHSMLAVVAVALRKTWRLEVLVEMAVAATGVTTPHQRRRVLPIVAVAVVVATTPSMVLLAAAVWLSFVMWHLPQPSQPSLQVPPSAVQPLISQQ